MSVDEQAPGRGGRHAVILCHPDPHSFNHAIAARYCDAVRAAGQDVVLRDLYAMRFDPVLKADERPTLADPRRAPEVTAERELLAGCDLFVLIYPIWFGSPPAMMKGYIERVFGAGVTPEAVRRQVRDPLLGRKRLLSFTTAALSNVWLEEEGQEQGLRSVLDAYLVHAFGMQSHEHRRFDHITPDLSRHAADVCLRDVQTQARRSCAQVAFGDEALMHDPDLVRQVTQ
ncbi:NAD(P)H-dependent oxidoreductase [Sphingomonas sp. 22R3R2A-7]|uniref:NAD(P)H-dependent oxidoreductase n=1 Tax=Sphingomonas sp. 22R3R2A-7 TaxID=3050230 RepID=UPI002FDF59A4